MSARSLTILGIPNDDVLCHLIPWEHPVIDKISSCGWYNFTVTGGAAVRPHEASPIRIHHAAEMPTPSGPRTWIRLTAIHETNLTRYLG
jgi:hypothetical protein